MIKFKDIKTFDLSKICSQFQKYQKIRYWNIPDNFQFKMNQVG